MTFATCSAVFSQEVYFKAGKNHTKYQYSTKEGVENTLFETDLGSVYELGYSFPFKRLKGFSYDVALTLNEFNAVVGVSQSNLKWKTEYAGIQNAISFTVLKVNRFALDVKTGFNLSTIVYGKEEVNGVVFDLKDLDGFKGVIIQPIFALEANFYASKHGYLSLGYSYSNSMSTVKYPEKFSFETNQVVFGIHLPIEKSEKKTKKNDKKIGYEK